MVFPNFFITFVRHSFHTSHPCTSPSRETASPYTVLPPDTTLPSWHTRCLTRHAHATHPRLSQRTRPPPHYNPRKGLCHMRSSPSQHTHPPHYNPRKGLCHIRCSPSQHHIRPPHYNHRKGLCHAHAPRAKMPQCFPLQPSPF